MKEENAKKRENEEAVSICLDAAVKFLTDHLGRWASFFGDQVAKSARLPFYRLIGRWLLELIESGCRRLNVQPERVTGWNPEPTSTTEFECGLDDEAQVPQPLTVTK